MVMAQSLFITLKQKFPTARIDVLAPAWTFSLLDRMPEVSGAIAMPLGHGQLGIADRYTLGRRLRSRAYDRAIVLPNSWKSALVPFFARIPVRTGYLGELRWGLLTDARRLNKRDLPMTVQRFVALGLPADVPVPPPCPEPRLGIDAKEIEKVREKFELTKKKKVLGLCPGAEYGPAKRWPSEYFAAVARRKLDQDWEVWLFGSEKDRVVTAQINRLCGNACRDFSGATTLAEAVDLVSLTDAVISNDSGLMHVAAALDRMLVAIYGSSDPGFTPPLSGRAQIICLDLDCSPCFERECPLGHYNCLKLIEPERVMAALDGDR